MKVRFLCLHVLLIILLTADAPALTDLDYSLGRSKYGSCVISGDGGYHGRSSASLGIEGKGHSIRVTVDFDEPMPIEMLDSFKVCLRPGEGDGKIRTQIQLDGDGDGRYSSKALEDANLYNTSSSWIELGWESGEWMEVDASALLYKRTRDMRSGDIDFWKFGLDGSCVVKISISLYGNIPGKSTCSLDYLRIGDQLISFEPLETADIKRSKQRSVAPGGAITYTITYGNNLPDVLERLVVVEKYDPSTLFISSVPPPDPGTNNVWTFGPLAPGEHGQITVRMVTAKHSAKADITGQVIGSGMSIVRRRMDSDKEGYVVTNTVHFMGPGVNMSAVAKTAVKAVIGMSLSFQEHGFGSYSSKDRIRLTGSTMGMELEMHANRTSNASIPTWADLYLSNSSWYASHVCENFAKKTYISDRYLYGQHINLSQRASMRTTSTSLETQSDFNGTAIYDSRWKDAGVAQMLIGSFRANKSIYTLR